MVGMGFRVQGSESKRLIKYSSDMRSLKTPGRKELVALAAQTLRLEVRCHFVTFWLAVQAETNIPV